MQPVLVASARQTIEYSYVLPETESIVYLFYLSI